MIITIRNRWIIAIFWHRWPWNLPRHGIRASHALWFHWLTFNLFRRRFP